MALISAYVERTDDRLSTWRHALTTAPAWNDQIAIIDAMPARSTTLSSSFAAFVLGPYSRRLTLASC